MNRLAAACFAPIVVTSCSSEQSRLPDYRANPHSPGKVASVERMGWYPAIAIRALFWYASLPEPVSVSDGVELYRISYWSRVDGKSALLSGLLALPTGGQVRGTVLYLHGTKTNRADSPSNPSLKNQEALLISCAFAGGGYLLAAPDLSGLGVSHAPPPYFINRSTLEQSLDFLRAVRTVASDMGHKWNPDLYVFGFSQGAHNAAVIQRELERLNDPVWKVKASRHRRALQFRRHRVSVRPDRCGDKRLCLSHKSCPVLFGLLSPATGKYNEAGHGCPRPATV